jgi:branched-chain amino acid transport system ATP-binding protein
VTAPVVSVKDVDLHFAGVKALSGVSFEVSERELFAIIGPNGAGKTSIFNVLSGVYRPQSGSVTFLGDDLLGRRPHVIAGLGMARTFQNIELFENLDVIDNLMLGRHHRLGYGWPSAVAWLGRARSAEVQKRIELGRALAMEPRLLLLDEPVAGMNGEETEDMARFILDIRSELGIAMILVEHDMGLVMDLADRVMAMDFGRPITTGVPAAVQADPEVIRAYLGTTDLEEPA